MKLRQRTEHVRQQKVQERPKLGQVVLQRRAGEQELVRGGNVLQLANEFAIKVFQSMAFVDDQVLEVVLGQKLSIRHDHLVRGDDDAGLTA